MKSIINQFIRLILFIFITNTNFLQAHDTFNGGCKNHCQGSVKLNTIEKDSNNNDKNQINDNYSCLSKSLCRGW